MMKTLEKFIFNLICFILLGCSSTTQTEEAHQLGKWAGKPISKLMEHPYFKTLPKKESSQEDGYKTLLFTNQSKFQTGAYCQSLGGCMGMPTYNCQHLVKYKDEIISGIEQMGICPSTDTTSP